MYKALTLLSILFLLSACSHGEFYPFWAKPVSLDIMDAPPGPPEYQQGYRDGCESGYKGYSQHYNKIWWKFKQDPELRSNKVYYQIWKDAYAYCANFANTAGAHGIGNYGNDGFLPY